MHLMFEFPFKVGMLTQCLTKMALPSVLCAHFLLRLFLNMLTNLIKDVLIIWISKLFYNTLFWFYVGKSVKCLVLSSRIEIHCSSFSWRIGKIISKLLSSYYSVISIVFHALFGIETYSTMRYSGFSDLS